MDRSSSCVVDAAGVRRRAGRRLCPVVSLTRCTGGQSRSAAARRWVSDQLIDTSLTYQPVSADVPKTDRANVHGARPARRHTRERRPRPAAAPASPHHPPALDARGEGQERRARQREDQQRQRAERRACARGRRRRCVGGALSCASAQVRKPRQRDVRRGLHAGPRVRRGEGSPGGSSRGAPACRARASPASLSQRAPTARTVVVTVAAGRGAARTSDAGLGLHRGRGRARRARPAGRRVGARRAPARRAGTAAASDAAATTATQRRCALAPMSANRTLGRSTVLPVARPCNRRPPIQVGEGASPAGRPTQNRPTGPSRAVSPPSSRGPAHASPSGSPGVHRTPGSPPGTCELRVARRRRCERGVGLQDRATAAHALLRAPAHWRCSGRTGRRGVRTSALAVPGLWPSAWTFTPPHPAAWSADWVVWLSLPAADFAADALTCLTSPSSPLLLIRTGALVLQAPDCVEVADESAFCLLDAH